MLFSVSAFDTNGVDVGYDSRPQGMVEVLDSVKHMHDFAELNDIVLDFIYVTSYLEAEPRTICVYSKKIADIHNQ